MGEWSFLKEQLPRAGEIFFAPLPPLSLLLPIVHPLGRTFFLSPVFHCLKISTWKQNFLRCERSHEKISPALQAKVKHKENTQQFIKTCLKKKIDKMATVNYCPKCTSPFVNVVQFLCGISPHFVRSGDISGFIYLFVYESQVQSRGLY